MIQLFYEGCTIEEILAYRELESESFNFGEGDMKMEGLLGSEDVYYRIHLQIHSESLYPSSLLPYCDNECNGNYESNKTRKKRNNHFNKTFEKRKLEKINKTSSWWTISDKGTHKTRCYLSQGKGTNRKKISKEADK